MKNMMKQLSISDMAFVNAFLADSMNSNQPRSIRINEMRQSAANIAPEHGEVTDLEFICDKLEEELMYRNGHKCDSWGYKETGKKLAKIILETRSN